MNKEEILAMEAGSEINTLIAEKVMEWKERVDFDYVDGHIARYIPNSMDVKEFSPSTDISAAWEVVESMKKFNWWVVISIADDKWNALFFWDPNQEAFEAQSSTAPLAICRAALLAVME